MDRVDFKIAGATSRRLLEAAREADPPLRFSEFRVVAAVDSVTTSWSKVEDTVAVSQIAELSGHHSDTTARILKRLSAREDIPISYVPGNGKGNLSTVRVTCVPQRSTSSPVVRRPPKVEQAPRKASTFSSSKVDSDAPKVDLIPPSDRATEVDLPNESKDTREGPTPNPAKKGVKRVGHSHALCEHGNIDTISKVCPECQAERREARKRALGGRSLRDFLRGGTSS